MNKRLNRMESWTKWIIGFGVGTVGLSIVTVRFRSNKYFPSFIIYQMIFRALYNVKLDIRQESSG